MVNPRSLRRLAADHRALHNHGLPPNYLFPPANTAQSSDDLTQLDLLLAGPTHTPYSAGVWKLHLTIPADYPSSPPTAHFRTPIFHPNVDPQTGAVCVETLKRDWVQTLTLRDVLVTISCLLIQPNPDSALNAEAGGLIQEEYEVFARRARLMTSINALVPKGMHAAVEEAQNRGQARASGGDGSPAAEPSTKTDASVHAAADGPAKRPRPIAKVRAKMEARVGVAAEGSPSRGAAHAPPSTRPFVFQAGDDDVFGSYNPGLPRSEPFATPHVDDSSIILDRDQENDGSRSPAKPPSDPFLLAPRRPATGLALPHVPRTLDSSPSTDESADMEAEYPPSPRKSPVKQAAREWTRPESSREAALRHGCGGASAASANITPPNQTAAPLATDSPFFGTAGHEAAASPSPRKVRNGGLFAKVAYSGVTKPSQRTPSSSSSSASSDASTRKRERAAQLWDLCGRDIKRWNRGDFAGDPFRKKAGRW